MAMVLCKGYQVPPEFDNPIFSSENIPFDFNELYKIADANINPTNNVLNLVPYGPISYLIAVIQVCMDRHIDLLIHYFDNNGEYKDHQYLGFGLYSYQRIDVEKILNIIKQDLYYYTLES